jgi:chromosome segregation ATPase
MSRFLQYFNLVGVLALAALCAVQWRTNRHANLQTAELQRTRLEQLATLAEQEKAIQGDVADLDDFRTRLARAESALTEVQGKLVATSADRDQAAAQRDQLRAALDKLIAAVAARDGAMQQAGEQIKKLAGERNEAVVKFNDLAAKYNALVKQFNAATTRRSE